MSVNNLPREIGMFSDLDKGFSRILSWWLPIDVLQSEKFNLKLGFSRHVDVFPTKSTSGFEDLFCFDIF